MSGNREALVEALVGNQWGFLYQTNAEFHAAIDHVASMLPVWVDGLAHDAEVSERDRKLQMELLMKGEVNLG